MKRSWNRAMHRLAMLGAMMAIAFAFGCTGVMQPPPDENQPDSQGL